MIRTELRRMDMLSATVGALDEQQGHRTLWGLSKGNKERLIEIPSEVAWHPDAWCEGAKAAQKMGNKGWGTLKINIDKHLLGLREKILSCEEFQVEEIGTSNRCRRELDCQTAKETE